MGQSSGEAIEVQAVFSPRALHPRPVSLRWHGRHYPVEKVHLVYETWEGDTCFLLYSITAGGAFLELRYDMKKARWMANGGSGEAG